MRSGPEGAFGLRQRNEYFVYGDLPVHVFQAQDGLHVEVLDWGTGRLEPRPEYLLEIEFGGQAREVPLCPRCGEAREAARPVRWRSWAKTVPFSLRHRSGQAREVPFCPRCGLVREVTPEQFERVLLEQQDKWKASRFVHSA